MKPQKNLRLIKRRWKSRKDRLHKRPKILWNIQEFCNVTTGSTQNNQHFRKHGLPGDQRISSESIFSDAPMAYSTPLRGCDVMKPVYGRRLDSSRFLSSSFQERCEVCEEMYNSSAEVDEKQSRTFSTTENDVTKFYPEDQCVLETLKPLSDEWFHGYSQFDFTANSSYESGDDFSFSNDHVYIEQVFPLASEEDFYGIELVLMLNPELQHRLSKHFSSLGGENSRELTNLILSHCLSQKIWGNFNHQARRTKKIAFERTMLYKVLKRSLSTRFSNQDEESVDITISRFFKSARSLKLAN